jgi:hypothetical protein
MPSEEAKGDEAMSVNLLKREASAFFLFQNQMAIINPHQDSIAFLKFKIIDYFLWDRDFEAFPYENHTYFKLDGHAHSQYQQYSKDILKYKHMLLILLGISQRYSNREVKTEMSKNDEIQQNQLYNKGFQDALEWVLTKANGSSDLEGLIDQIGNMYLAVQQENLINIEKQFATFQLLTIKTETPENELKAR